MLALRAINEEVRSRLAHWRELILSPRRCVPTLDIPNRFKSMNPKGRQENSSVLFLRASLVVKKGRSNDVKASRRAPPGAWLSTAKTPTDILVRETSSTEA
jgi:hypothetical protein